MDPAQNMQGLVSAAGPWTSLGGGGGLSLMQVLFYRQSQQLLIKPHSSWSSGFAAKRQLWGRGGRSLVRIRAVLWLVRCSANRRQEETCLSFCSCQWGQLRWASAAAETQTVSGFSEGRSRSCSGSHSCSQHHRSTPLFWAEARVSSRTLRLKLDCLM